MSDFKRYPKEAPEVRSLVERRRHYLNLIYAMTILATFQLCTSVGWFSYVNEAYYHMTDDVERCMWFVRLFGHFVTIFLLYMSIFVRRNALIVCIVLFYFVSAAMKLMEISTFYPDTTHRYKFSATARNSEYHASNLIYDAMMFFSSSIVTVLSLAAMWHFTPVVIVKMNHKKMSGRKLAKKSLKEMIKPRKAMCQVITSTSNDSLCVSEAGEGQSYKAKIARKRTTRAKITDKAQVKVTNHSVDKEIGGVFDGAKQITHEKSEPN